MRSATTAQNTAITSAYYTPGLRVLIADADGNLRDWSNQAGANWIDSVEIDADVDTPVNGATITLRREAGATSSLSPFRTDSPLNRNNASAYAPAINAGRLVIVQVATVTAGTTPVTGDFVEVFRGSIDRVAWATTSITLTCRDLGANNADRYVKQKTTYGTATGVPLQDVMQAILVDWGDGSTLYVPTSPSFNITTYEQQPNQSVIDALLALAQTCGWTVRTIWNPTAGAFQLALLDPQRTKSTPDQTIGPSRYLAVSDLFVDRTNIRNDFELNYNDASTGPSTMALSDGASQAQYGYRWLGITESSTSPINTGTEALAMLTAMRADLKDPKAEHEITLHIDWRIEVGDLLKLQANGVHYDTDQTGAVVSFKHVLTPTQHRTTVRTRGAPAGQYLNWFNRGIGTPLTSGPNLAVMPKQVGTNFVITWSGDDVQLSTDGGTTWGTPGTSPITVAMNAPGGAAKTYTFKGYRDGVAIQIPVTIPAQSGSTAPSLSLTPSIATSQVDDATSAVVLTLAATNLPTAYTWTLYSGAGKGKRTTILASGSQSTNPLSGNPTVNVTPLAKLFIYCTLVVFVGSDQYVVEIAVNPYQPAFDSATGLKLGTGVTDSRGAGYNLNRSYNLDQHSLDDVVDNPGGTYARAKAAVLNAGRPISLYRVTGAQTIDADTLGKNLAVVSNNLLTNGGAQDGALAVQASGWSKIAGVDMVPTTADCYAGDRSFVIDHGGSANSSAHRETATLTAGRVYRMRVALRQVGLAGTSNSGAFIRIWGPSDLASEFTLLDNTGFHAASTTELAVGVVADGGTSDPWVPVQATFIANVTGTFKFEAMLGLTANVTGKAYFDDMVLEEMAATPMIGGFRGSQALDSNYRLVDQRRIPMTNVGGARSQFFLAGTQTTADGALTSSDNQITIPAVDLFVGDTSPLSYATQTITGTASASGKKNWVYLLDATYSGSGTFVAVTDPRELVKYLTRAYLGTITCFSGGGGTGQTCPAPETMIRLADGTERAAGALRVGDHVATRHEDSLEDGAWAVTHVSLHTADRWQLTLADGRTLIATPNHRVYVWGEGWTRLDALTPGDVVMGEPAATVVRVHPLDHGPVVKITVDQAHTYLSAGLLSHNQKVV